MYDTVIVGAGLAGSVLARQLAEIGGKRVLLVEKRTHIGGNCYDSYDRHGVLVHKYGPHLFHTSNKEVFDYLGRFTEWHEYQHRVLAAVDGKKVPVPFNLNSLEMLFPKSMAESLEKKLVERFGFGVKVPILELIKTDDPELKALADFIYQKIFYNYTLKQWGFGPEDISPEVMERVPVFISRDNRYFQDTYQAVPKFGYTRMFRNMMDHPDIHTMLNTDYKDIVAVDMADGGMKLFGDPFEGDLIFTGMIDELFAFRFGQLPYRTLDFSFESLEQEYFQEVAVVNYPNDFDFTRITEFKRIHGQKLKHTTLLREYPRDYESVGKEADTPCYPVFKDANLAQYEKYLHFSGKFPKLTLVGRLAEYRYYDMDDIVARALEVFDQKFS
ncbi:MAG: UDP-galactopyranose mutase [Desulfobulbaceae bacterium]|nr:UDP-galactopyranose mutase [Desulfobulbaceae bacterium]